MSKGCFAGLLSLIKKLAQLEVTMWNIIYNYALMIVWILGIIVDLWLIGKGKHMRQSTPLGSALNMLLLIAFIIGFLMWYW
jgi:hypothetical protein